VKTALLVGRFHAVTKAQAQWIESLQVESIAHIVCVVTSANHESTRRNPLSSVERSALMNEVLKRSQKSFEVVCIDDVPESNQWPQHVLSRVNEKSGGDLNQENCAIYSSNRDVTELFLTAGFEVIASPLLSGITPHELILLMANGKPWHHEASVETIRLYSDSIRLQRIKALFTQTLVTEDGELGHQRDFHSYGQQMDASLRQKLDDMSHFVQPECIVDKGCGTGKLLVALSHRWPESKFVGVDLREFLRLCDENTYAAQDVEFVQGNVIDQNVASESASTVIFSSVMHEVHSYTGYKTSEIHRALRNAHKELKPGGVVIVRDGVSPDPATWRMKFLKPELIQIFNRFAKEFRHGQGVKFQQIDSVTVELSSHDANEFICKKDYQTNWHIEVHEEFGPLTLSQWKEALRVNMFNIVHAQEYVNEWIRVNRYEGSVQLTNTNGTPVPWPASNIVVVGQRI
jgi:ubiquinone/menaquinone biosynthesis C-methylase UbiE/nicotinamide mononucleotide adenylyltransferase